MHSPSPAAPPTNIAPIFAQAVGLHQAGRLAEAEDLYRAVLAAEPTHFRSLYYLGIVSLQTGRPGAAVEAMTRALAVNDGVAEVHYNLGLALQALRRTAEAVAHYERATQIKRDYAEAYTNLGNARMELGQFAAALADYQRAVALQGPTPFSHYNIANVLVRLDRTADAEAHFRAAIAGKPDFAEAFNNYGNLLRDAERLDEAEASYARALSLRPNYPEARNNIGAIMTARGAVDAAISHYREAIKLNPRFAEAYSNLGVALLRHGDADGAMQVFQHALVLNPGNLETTHNLARALFQVGDVNGALDELKRGIESDGNAETKSLFTRYARDLPAKALEPMRVEVGRALAEGWARGYRLERPVIALIKARPEIAALIDQVRQLSVDSARPAQPTLSLAEFACLAKEPLLHDLMTLACVSDHNLEIVLTAARRSLLTTAESEQSLDGEPLKFCCALARQCFFNEYAFFESEDERDRVGRLHDRIIASLQGGKELPLPWLVAFAAYAPLHALPSADALCDQTWPQAFQELLQKQIIEPREEREIAAQLRSLTSVDDDISRKVQQQYEENPYPRWELIPPPTRAVKFDQQARAKFPRAPYQPIQRSGPLEFLIAGCGTGIHAIESFHAYADVRMLAIDLSRASLAYATRKARELGLPVEFAQADILKLGDLGRSFDVIEAAGSLQCLADPATGWRVLASLLKPNGVMILGLYSKLSRTAVNAVRSYIANRNYQGTPADIRRCRQELLALPAGSPEHSVTMSQDFYSMSECRDLLFHVQEYQHTLPEIKAFLDAENLQFLGFDIDARVLRLYAEKNPSDPAMIDLDRWHQLETAHPATFAGMYQFFIQKR